MILSSYSGVSEGHSVKPEAPYVVCFGVIAGLLELLKYCHRSSPVLVVVSVSHQRYASNKTESTPISKQSSNFVESSHLTPQNVRFREIYKTKT